MKINTSTVGKQVAITVICLLLGFAISLQLKSVRFNSTLSSDNLRAQELQTRLNDEIEKNESLTADLEKAKAQLSELRENSENSVSQVVEQQLENAEKLAGLVALKGPGITVTMSDSKSTPPTNSTASSIIHDSDIRTVVNELLASGAEAISINGERIVSTSSIRCVGPTVIINNTRLSTPFVITAIGDSKTLEAGLIVKGGVVDALTPWGIDITILPLDKVEVPAYSGSTAFKYAEIAKQESPGAGSAKGGVVQ